MLALKKAVHALFCAMCCICRVLELGRVSLQVSAAEVTTQLSTGAAHDVQGIRAQAQRIADNGELQVCPRRRPLHTCPYPWPASLAQNMAWRALGTYC